MMADLTFFEARFETASDIPPPFCYYYHLICELKNGKWLADFTWKYHLREDLTLDEIQDEGFSGEDDFGWKGEVPAVLVKAISEKLLDIKLSQEENLADNDNYLFLVFRKNKQAYSGLPVPHEDFEYFLQEIIQGIYEISGKEAPLQLGFLKNEPASSQKVMMTISFSERNVILEVFKNKLPSSKKKNEDWEAIQNLINRVFSLELNPEKAHKKLPSGIGYFVSAGDGLWYETKNWEGFINQLIP